MILFVRFVCIFFLLALAGCRESSAPGSAAEKSLPASVALGKPGCVGCHDAVLDAAHDFSCAACHRGNPAAAAKDAAHKGFVAHPAHPDSMAETCGRCHREIVEQARRGLHFTHAREVNAVRRAFGATADIAGVEEIPGRGGLPKSALDLADDLLRRQCLRCHLAAPGEPYDAVRRGTGCAACHLDFRGGRMLSHAFRPRPGDQRCLACHYGNRVGADYHGLFEQDLNMEFRTPFAETGQVRPYGVETHRLAADVHQERGMICIDCHGLTSFHSPTGKTAAVSKLSCSSCHRPPEIRPLWPGLGEKNGLFFLRGKGDNKEHSVFALLHPAHRRFGARVDCQVCHAQWSFQDQGSSYLRHDAPDPDEWWRLHIQGSAALERLVAEGPKAGVGAPDPVSGEQYPGWWLRAFVQRRWEDVPLGRDRQGRLRVLRPAAEYRLSYVNAAGEVPFAELSAVNPAMRPYTPHTTGRAGLFYLQRLEKAGVLENADKRSW